MANHLRSISMPSTSHPTVFRVEEELQNLNARLASSKTAQAVPNEFQSVGDVYELIEELLSLPSSQQYLQTCQMKLVEQQLDRSLQLLDLVRVARESLVSMREHVQDLRSAIRRKGNQFNESRKKTQKMIKDCLKSLKLIGGKSVPCCIDDRSNKLVMVLFEAREITISLLRYVLSFLSKPKTKASRWSVISKRKVACEGENVDMWLQSSYDCILSKDFDAIRIEKAHNDLQAIEARMESLESGFEVLFKKLIQNRVSLLNILSL